MLIEALGVPIRLDIEGLTDAEASAVHAAWRDATLRSPERFESPRTVRVRAEGVTDGFARVLEILSQRVTVEAISARGGDLWMLHAAGLAAPDGRVIVLVGPSGRGKTTAARALGAHLGYVSDETVGIGSEGQVYAYRKPLSIVENAGDIHAPKVQRAPSDMGLGEVPAAPLRFAAIVLLDRRPDAPPEPLIEAVDFGDALADLARQSSALVQLDRPLHVMAGLVESVGGVLRVTYREAASLPDVISQLMAGAPRVANADTVTGAVPPPPARVESPASARDTGNPGWYRGKVIDELALTGPDRVVVAHASETATTMVRVLSGIAPALWRAASGASRDDLIAAAIAAHGEPEGEDAGALVDAAIAELADVGLLDWRATPPSA
ncbi:hypothetical protein [uncultured Microbacterium sp.]|uniref:hypothetical protein n=1 Tax=uncultured Microbacterium sp. TaxID=191216 RepID=UPI00262CC5EA|nr:hypothetical protein [uncultured Microbacterium sp.]